MLGFDEENKLANILETVQEDLIHGTMEDLKTQLEKIEWLAEKLKECNDELKEVAKEIDRNNKIPEVYKNPKNEISVRFYPR